MSSYSGRLQVNEEWLDVTISIDEVKVGFRAYGEDLGVYRREEVEIGFDGGEHFALTVDDETLLFSPDARSAFGAAIVQIPDRGSRGGRHAASRRIWRQRQAWS